jgi:hypothetical protein
VSNRYAARSRGRDVSRLVAAGVCTLQAVALLGFCVFYLWELTRGEGDDPTRVVMSALLIALFSVALAALGWAWWRGSNWPGTPTLVWNVLLLPVAWSLLQSGQPAVAGVVALVAVTATVASLRADTTQEPAEQPPERAPGD